MLLRQAPMFGREARGQRLGVIRWNVFSLASCPLPLTWFQCDFSPNRHKQRGLTRYRETDGTKIWQWTLGTGRVSG
jgi:hypothetical protein